MSRTSVFILIMTLLIVQPIHPLGLQALTPSEDYVQGEIILTFSEAYMPARTEISLSQHTFGIPVLDSLLAHFNAVEIKKIIPSYNGKRTEAGRRLEKKFLIRFDGNIDAQDLVSEFSRYPHLGSAKLNRIYHKQYYGVKRFVPDSGTEFDKQWNLDWPRDSLDIDAPEAWAIEPGDDEVIICIIDSGTMLDTLAIPWKLHSDFNYHWIDAEDSHSPDSLTWDDIELDDDNNDDYNDNIIGYCWDKGFGHSGDEKRKGFWHSIPQNFILEDPDDSWIVSGYFVHGLLVSSIAAATVSGNDIVGIAHGCKVYILRDQNLRYGDTDLASFIAMIDHASSVANVINMSWGFFEEINTIDEDVFDAIADAAEGQDCVLVAAAGNEGSSELISYPASDTLVLAVGNIDSLFDLSANTNYAEEGGIDVVAVGEYIWADSTSQCGYYDYPSQRPCPQPIIESTGPTGNGTSFSAPQAAGIAALIRSRFPGLNQEQVRNRIKNSANFYWENTEENRRKYGSGYINAYRALTEWGEITEDTTWDPSYVKDGCYYISGDLTVKEGVTLTINRGTKIRIAPEDNESAGSWTTKVEFIVEGTLVTGGSGTEDIVFESFLDGTPGPTDWIGIRFESTSTNNSLEGVTIKNATAPIFAFAPVTLTDCDISQCIQGVIGYDDIDISNTKIHDASTGIEMRLGHATLDSVEVYDCATALALTLQNNNVASATCTDCYFHDLELYGVASTRSTRDVVLQNTTIEDSYYGAFYALGSDGEVNDCTIKNNDIGVVLDSTSDPVIVESAIDSNATDGIYCSSASDIAIRSTTIRYSPVGIYSESSSPTIESKCHVQYNDEGIKCDYESDAVVESTLVSNNDIGISAINGSNPDLGHVTGGSSIGENSIHTNDSYHVDNQSVGVTIIAENNYWGNAPPDSTKFNGDVDYEPYQSSAPSLVAPFQPDQPITEKSIPTEFNLGNSYPNPFNPETRILFDIPSSDTEVSITIYNVHGQVVNRLFNGHKNPGCHGVSWNGISDSGENVASGIYFVHMRTANFSMTKKLVLLK